jgi:hypothetical protein
MTTEESSGAEEAQDGPGALAYVAIYGRQFGVVGDMYLTVVGACLVALAVVVLLDGFGFVSAGYTGSTGALLGSGFVLAVVGLFALGVASEGPMTGSVVPAPELHLTTARAIGIVVVCVVGNLAADFLAEPASRISYPFELGVVALRVASRAGLVGALTFGVAGVWALRWRYPVFRQGWDRLVLLGVWVVSAWIVLAASL